MTSSPNTSNGRVGRSALYAGVLVLPVLLAAACSGPEPLPMAELVRQDGAYLHPVTMQPYSGPVFTSYDDPSHRIQRRARLRNGHYDGAFELYFENSRLSLREVYREGEKDGPYEWYFESGQLYERGTYENGLREGPYEAFFGEGQLYEKGTYRHGDFHGPREWYLDGQLIERVTYVDGRIDGPYERYLPDGDLQLQGTLQYGNPCGSWLEGGERVVHASCDFESD